MLFMTYGRYFVIVIPGKSARTTHKITKCTSNNIPKDIIRNLVKSLKVSFGNGIKTCKNSRICIVDITSNI